MKKQVKLKRLLKATGFWKDNALILRELRHFPVIVALAILFPLLAAIFEGFGIGFLLGFLQSLVNSGGPPFQTGIGWFDVWVLGIDKPELERLYRCCALILTATWIRAAFNYLSTVYMSIAQLRLIDRLYKQIFEQLQSLSLQFFSTTRSGSLLNALTAEVGQLQNLMGQFAFILTKGSVLVMYAAIALWISVPLSIMAIVLFSLAGAGLSNLNKRVREASFPVSEARGRFTSAASEFINGIRTVQAFATQDFERRRYHAASDDIVATTTVATQRLSLVRPLAEGIATTVLVGMIIVSLTIFVENGVLQIASLLTFLFLLFRLVPAMQEMVGSFAGMSSLQGSLHAIQELLRTDNKPYLQNGYRSFGGLQRAIELLSVDFGYEPQSLVLKGVTLTIEQGKTIALVGSSGAGKSTLADLLPRFYDVTQGKILLDGVDLREFDINSVRQRMAIVSQETFIFNASIRENVAYGSEGATQTEIEAAVQMANADEFIRDLPDGYDTVLGDRGVRLSGGQRQRIAIARALLRNPEILILDEATSALDSVSERLIQASLEKLAVGRTVIAIAHRLSTIANADKVVVMDQGRIVEQGSYKQLLALRGKLWNYHQIQNEVSQSRS